MDLNSRKNLDNIISRFSQDAPLKMLTTGFKGLDSVLCGIKGGELITLAGRPNMGKTDFIMNIILNESFRQGVPVMLFSTESNLTEILERSIAINGVISKKHIRSNRLEPEELRQIKDSIEHLNETPFFIENKAFLTVEDIIESTRMMVKENGIRMIFIDSLHLIRNKSMVLTSFSRHDYLSKIVMDLKALALEQDIAIVVTSKMNRNIETEGRMPKLPQLSDLRESGAIEDTSDIVIFLDRPEVYTNSHEDECGNDIRGLANLHVEKIRGTSEKGDVRIHYDIRTGRYTDWDEYQTDLSSNLPPIDPSVLDGPTPF